MANVKVKTIGAIINGQPIGSTIELSKAEAEYFAKVGYVEVMNDQATQEPVKKESAPKKPESNAKPKGKSKAKDK